MAQERLPSGCVYSTAWAVPSARDQAEAARASRLANELCPPEDNDEWPPRRWAYTKTIFGSENSRWDFDYIARFDFERWSGAVLRAGMRGLTTMDDGEPCAAPLCIVAWLPSNPYGTVVR